MYFNFTLFWLRLKSDEQKTLMNLKIGAFYLLSFFIQARDMSKWVKQIQLASQIRNMPLHVKKMLDINKLQATRELIHVIKGAVRLYFMHYSCVVIILFNTD